MRSADHADVAAVLPDTSRQQMADGWTAYEVPVSAARARALLRTHGVDATVTKDSETSVNAFPTDSLVPNQWALPAMTVTQTWDWPVKEQMVVAVVDQGVDFTHTDLAPGTWNGNANHGFNVLTNGGPIPGESHGTHVAGIINAAWNGTGVAGVAPSAKVMSVRALGADGRGTTVYTSSAIRWAIANGARIINMSLGGTGAGDNCEVIEEGVQKGVLFVAAAGNDGRDIDAVPYYPAGCPSAGLLTVSATTRTGRLATFSNWGAKNVDIAAPGDSITSAVPGDRWVYKSGTSMSAPQVSGAAALLWGIHPEWDANRVRQAILHGGDPLNIDAALRWGENIPADSTPPPPPTVTGPTKTYNGFELSWDEVRDPESGIKSYRVLLDGVVTGTHSGTINRVKVTPPAGNHTWTVQAVNYAGRVSDGSVEVEQPAPSEPAETPSALAPGSETTITTDTVTLTWKAPQAGTAVTVYVDDVIRCQGATQQCSVPLENGTHNWFVAFRDTLDRITQSPVMKLTVAVPAPPPPAVAPAPAQPQPTPAPTPAPVTPAPSTPVPPAAPPVPTPSPVLVAPLVTALPAPRAPGPIAAPAPRRKSIAKTPAKKAVVTCTVVKKRVKIRGKTVTRTVKVCRVVRR